MGGKKEVQLAWAFAGRPALEQAHTRNSFCGQSVLATLAITSLSLRLRTRTMNIMYNAFYIQWRDYQ